MEYLRLDNIGTDMHNYDDNRLSINLYRKPTIIENDYSYWTPNFGQSMIYSTLITQ